MSRRPTSRSENLSYVAKLKTTLSEDDLKQQCQGTFQTQKNPTVFKLSSRLASVSKGSDVGQPMLGSALVEERQEIPAALNPFQESIAKRRRHGAMLLCALNELARKSKTDMKAEMYEIAKQLYRTIYGNDLPADGLARPLPPFPKPQHVRDELFATDESKRPSVQQCLEHAFCKSAREIRIEQKKESVAEEVKRAAVKTVERSVETAETQSTMHHVLKRSSPEAKTQPLVCARPMPPLLNPEDQPSKEVFLHRDSELLAEGTAGQYGKENATRQMFTFAGINLKGEMQMPDTFTKIVYAQCLIIRLT